MGHKCEYFAELKSKKDIYFKIRAVWQFRSEYVYKENLKGESKCRYLYYSNLAGYLVTFPNEKHRGYYGYIQEKEKMWSCYPCNLYARWETREQDLKELELNHPELKYFIRKQNISDIYAFMRVLRVYKEHPEIEPLIERDLIRIATDKRLFKLTDKKRKQVMSFIKSHITELTDETSLSDVLYIMKNGRRKEEIATDGLKAYKPNYEVIDGFSIFIPNEFSLCERQANELHQCIIKSSYVSDMAKHKTLLIFITKDDGTPIATCQIDNKTKEIRQFYANELDRRNCLPTKPMRVAMDKYINKLDLNNLYIGA